MSVVRRHPVLRGMLLIIVGFLLLAAALAAWAFIEPKLLLVSRSTVYSPDLPEEFDGAKIVFVSDIHAGEYADEARVAKIADRATTLGADAILLGGDYFDGDRGADIFLSQAARFRARHGVVAVLGNHDAWTQAEAREKLAEKGIVLLYNESARLRRNGGIIRVAGIQDYNTRIPNVREAARDIRRRDYAILLSHNPDVLPKQLQDAQGAFDLVLTGHMHGGQVSLFGLYSPYLPSEYGQRFKGGWTTVDNVPVLVSRGAGVFIKPIRFFAPPELHLIELRKGVRKTKS